MDKKAETISSNPYKAGLAMNGPSLQQMRIVYQNEQQSVLTPEALRTCQNQNIDYKELLPRQKTEQANDLVGLSTSQIELKIRQHELRRTRRILQISKLIQDQYGSPQRVLSQSKAYNRVVNLSMSNEEKMLRTTYGQNFEQQFATTAPKQNNVVPPHKRNQSLNTSMAQGIHSAGNRHQKSHGQLQNPYNMSPGKQNDGNGTGRSNTGLANANSHLNPYAMHQRQEENKAKWFEIIKNKEKNMQTRHKELKDKMAKQQKFDKAKLKKMKDQDATRKFLQEKKEEKLQQIQQRRKHTNEEFNAKLQDVEARVASKLQTAEQNRLKNLDIEMKQRQQKLMSLQMETESYEGAVALKKNFGLSKSANFKNMKIVDSDVQHQMYNIEKRIAKANEKRDSHYSGTLEKQQFESNKIDKVLCYKAELKEKIEYDTMNKVILKHHQKDVKLKKQAKEEYITQAFKEQKKEEKNEHQNGRVMAIRDARNDKVKGLQKKFDKIDQSKKNLERSQIDYMSAKREENMFRQLDHNEKFKRVKRGQSAYKRHLVEKILEKGNRGRDVADRKCRIQELAIQNCQNLKVQFHEGAYNLQEIERNHKLELNKQMATLKH